MDGYQIIVMSTIGGFLGIVIAGPFFDCKVPPVKAFAAAAISGLCYAIPTVGAIVSLLGCGEPATGWTLSTRPSSRAWSCCRSR